VSCQILGKESNIPMMRGRNRMKLCLKRSWFSLSAGSDRVNENTQQP
jgi:hypothetical protein